MDLKIVLIGAASPQWGFTLMRDIVVVLSEDADLAERRPVLVLEDIDEVNLEKAHRLAEMVAARTGGRVRIQSTTDQREAIAAADFVITSLAVGSLEAMQADLEIPYEYGIHQPVGDTVSIGGAIRTARNVSAFLSIARDIENHAAPDAWLLNLSNPLSALTRAITRETSVNAVGLCHELYGGLATLSGWLGFDYRRWRETLEIGVLGINHCSWMQRLTIGDEDALPRLRRFIEERGIDAGSKRLYDSETPELRHENVKMVLFLRHGVWPYSGDRHNAEFFAEFVNRSTNLGADYGVMLTTIQSRLVDWRGFARQAVNQRLAGRAEIDLRVSEEAASRIIRAMTLDRPFYDVSNLPLPRRGAAGRAGGSGDREHVHLRRQRSTSGHRPAPPRPASGTPGAARADHRGRRRGQHIRRSSAHDRRPGARSPAREHGSGSDPRDVGPTGSGQSGVDSSRAARSSLGSPQGASRSRRGSSERGEAVGELSHVSLGEAEEHLVLVVQQDDGPAVDTRGATVGLANRIEELLAGKGIGDGAKANDRESERLIPLYPVGDRGCAEGEPYEGDRVPVLPVEVTYELGGVLAQRAIRKQEDRQQMPLAPAQIPPTQRLARRSLEAELRSLHGGRQELVRTEACAHQDEHDQDLFHAAHLPRNVAQASGSPAYRRIPPCP